MISLKANLVQMTYSRYCFFQLEAELLKVGTCEVCGDKAYLECEECFATIRFEGEKHNCPCYCERVYRPILCEVCEDKYISGVHEKKLKQD